MKEWIVCEDNCLKCSYGATLDCDGDCPRCPRNTYCPCVTSSIACRCSFDLDALRREVASLEQDASRPDLWEDRQRAQTTLKRLGKLRARLDRWDRFRARVKDLAELATMAGEDRALEAE